jgi:hypothetical protein
MLSVRYERGACSLLTRLLYLPLQRCQSLTRSIMCRIYTPVAKDYEHTTEDGRGSLGVAFRLELPLEQSQATPIPQTQSL